MADSCWKLWSCLLLALNLSLNLIIADVSDVVDSSSDVLVTHTLSLADDGYSSSPDSLTDTPSIGCTPARSLSQVSLDESGLATDTCVELSSMSLDGSDVYSDSFLTASDTQTPNLSTLSFDLTSSMQPLEPSMTSTDDSLQPTPSEPPATVSVTLTWVSAARSEATSSVMQDDSAHLSSSLSSSWSASEVSLTQVDPNGQSSAVTSASDVPSDSVTSSTASTNEVSSASSTATIITSTDTFATGVTSSTHTTTDTGVTSSTAPTTTVTSLTDTIHTTGVTSPTDTTAAGVTSSTLPPTIVTTTTTTVTSTDTTTTTGVTSSTDTTTGVTSMAPTTGVTTTTGVTPTTDTTTTGVTSSTEPTTTGVTTSTDTSTTVKSTDTTTTTGVTSLTDTTTTTGVTSSTSPSTTGTSSTETTTTTGVTSSTEPTTTGVTTSTDTSTTVKSTDTTTTTGVTSLTNTTTTTGVTSSTSPSTTETSSTETTTTTGVTSSTSSSTTVTSSTDTTTTTGVTPSTSPSSTGTSSTDTTTSTGVTPSTAPPTTVTSSTETTTTTGVTPSTAPSTTVTSSTETTTTTGVTPSTAPSTTGTSSTETTTTTGVTPSTAPSTTWTSSTDTTTATGVTSNTTSATPATTTATSSTNGSSIQTTSQTSLQASSSENVTATSTSSPNVVINASLVGECYRGLPADQLVSVSSLVLGARCAGNIVTKFGALLGNLTFPVLDLPDVQAILSRNASSASLTRLSGFNSSSNCSAFDFANVTDSVVMSLIGDRLLTGVPDVSTSLDTALARGKTCAGNVPGAASYSSELQEIYQFYANVTRLLKVYADGVMAALRNVTGCPDKSDCNGDCAGKAKWDEGCRTCYGGNTQYNIATAADLRDCNNVCLGTAFVEPCNNTCVGGTTGRTLEMFVDCAGLCGSTNIVDACGLCVASTSASSNTSQYQDCTHKCFVRANVSRMAVFNPCRECVLGDTNKPLTFGMDVCGVCSGNNSTCLDCEGNPNGGKVNDACGVCGGNGTSCLAVTSAVPTLVPSSVQKMIVVSGAGFSANLYLCVAKDTATGAETNLSRPTAAADNAIRLTLALPSTLSAGNYAIKCRQLRGDLVNSTAVITVYNSTVTTVSNVSKTSFTISPPSKETIEFQGTGLLFNSTFCKFIDTAGDVTYVEAAVLNQSSARCNLSHPGYSERYTVHLTFNQQDAVGPNFTVTALAAAPSISAQLSDDGDKIQVSFTPAADFQLDSTCEDIFSNKPESLGASAACTVISRQLVHITSSTGRAGSVLTLKDNAVRAYGQRFALAAMGNVTVLEPVNPVTPRAVLSGPDVVSSCAKSFTVDARRSTGLGGRDGSYSWTVTPSASIVISDNTSAVLTVSNLSAGKVYNVILNLCNFLGKCETASHPVQQAANNAPDVVIETMADVTKVKKSDRLMLMAKATLYPNCSDDQVVFNWSFSPSSVSNPEYVSRSVYTIDPYVLPAPATIVAVVEASLASNRSSTTTANINITTVISSLDARISGADVRTVGVGSGNFSLDATQSLDPDGLPGSLTFSWTCRQLTATNDVLGACLDKNGNVLPSSSAKTLGVMTLSSSDLEASKRYLFTAVVSKRSEGKTRFSTASVTVEAAVGQPPLVKLNLFNGKRGRYSVDQIVTVAAEINSFSSVTVQWRSSENLDYGYVNLSDSSVVGPQQEPLLIDSITGTYVAFLTIKAFVLSRGTRYRVLCDVTDTAGQSASAAVSFYIRRGVTSCEFTIAGGSYTELSRLQGQVDHCDTDPDGQPMTFEFFVFTDDTYTDFKRLTKPSSSDQLDISYGPKAFLSGGTNVFAVKVCAALGGCTWFRTTPVNVTAITSMALTAARDTIVNTARDMRKAGNPLDGLLSLAALLQSKYPSRSKRSAEVVTPEENVLALDLANETLSTMYPSETVLKTLLDGLASVPYDSLSNSDLLRLLSVYETIASAYTAPDVSPMQPSSVGQIKRFEKYLVSPRGLQTSEKLSQLLTSARRKSLPFGFWAETDIGSGTLTNFVQALSSTQSSTSSSNPVLIDFGDTLKKRYNSWACDGSQCLGAGVEVIQYNTDTNPYSTDTTRSSDVISISLFNQNSGDELANVTDLASPVVLTFPLTLTGDSACVCKYWDTVSRAWREDGVTTDLQTADAVVCKSTHLTPFSVFQDQSSSSDKSALIGGVVGGVLGGLLLIAIIVIVVLAVYIKKQNRVGSTPSLRRVLVKPEEGASSQQVKIREQPELLEADA